MRLREVGVELTSHYKAQTQHPLWERLKNFRNISTTNRKFIFPLILFSDKSNTILPEVFIIVRNRTDDAPALTWLVTCEPRIGSPKPPQLGSDLTGCHITIDDPFGDGIIIRHVVCRLESTFFSAWIDWLYFVRPPGAIRGSHAQTDKWRGARWSRSMVSTP